MTPERFDQWIGDSSISHVAARLALAMLIEVHCVVSRVYARQDCNLALPRLECEYTLYFVTARKALSCNSRIPMDHELLS